VDRLLPSQRRFAIECAAVAVVAAVLRVPFIGTIGPDEGGYAYVAWRWAHGGDLYRTLWIDRPQGLILVYRGLLAIAPSPWAIRLGAVIAAATTTLLLIAIGTLLVSRTVGILAGALYAFVGVGPRIEGYTFNGELAAAVPSTAAVAAALVGARRHTWGWFALAGALGGTAILMKQSGFDGLVVVLVVAAATGRRSIVAAVSAAALPLGASALAGWLAGWHFYWFDLVASHVGVASGAGQIGA
jgi:4-amino-4-deoxy-L-arabinose transferase-like glycosyltransferase